MPKFKNTNERVNEISNYPNSPKPKQKTETNRKNPLRQGVNFNSLSNMLKYFAVLKHGNKESKRKAVNNAGKKALKKIKK
ncbi:hypothetical protein [Bathycoccus sp. RCC716 virus 3]|nr:hypothetical protein [Bathycoccus sp. RCC716 virus 3]|tara:strand:- start:829 stop:1068 length:240 start_codon:yes stop_codon:yes gene_type:complete